MAGADFLLAGLTSEVAVVAGFYGVIRKARPDVTRQKSVLQRAVGRAADLLLHSRVAVQPCLAGGEDDDATIDQLVDQHGKQHGCRHAAQLLRQVLSGVRQFTCTDILVGHAGYDRVGLCRGQAGGRHQNNGKQAQTAHGDLGF